MDEMARGIEGKEKKNNFNSNNFKIRRVLKSLTYK
jgi:hypothetical protein